MAFSEAARHHPRQLLGAQESDLAKKKQRVGGREAVGLPGREIQRKITVQLRRTGGLLQHFSDGSKMLEDLVSPCK